MNVRDFRILQAEKESKAPIEEEEDLWKEGSHIEEQTNEPTEEKLEDVAAFIIQKAWRSYSDRNLFRTLVQVIRKAETSTAVDLLSKLSPTETQLAKDPGMQLKVRFRFMGPEFPPRIVYKVFLNGQSQYLTGACVIEPGSQAARQACNTMGVSLYRATSAVNEITRGMERDEILSRRDFLKWVGENDRKPACVGGRGNTWREVLLEGITSTTTTEALPEGIPTVLTPHYVERLEAKAKYQSARQSRAAKRRLRRLRKLFSTADDWGGFPHGSPPPPSPSCEFFVTQGTEEEEQADQLFMWAQQLSFEKYDETMWDSMAATLE